VFNLEKRPLSGRKKAKAIMKQRMIRREGEKGEERGEPPKFFLKEGKKKRSATLCPTSPTVDLNVTRRKKRVGGDDARLIA